MRKKLILTSIITIMAAAVVSCNSKDTDYTIEQSSSAQVTAFYIKNDSKVLDSLQNVYFTIDLVNARIFNADSLPYGTKVRRLIPSITTASGVQAVQLTYRVPETGRDSVVNYLKSSTDSIDFSAGPVKLTVTSQNGLVTRDYEIKVNVHRVKSDSLAWHSMESAKLPTTFAAPDAQCTAQCAGAFYCLTAKSAEYCMSVIADPSSPDWSSASVEFPFTPVVESLRAADGTLFILDTDRNLYKYQGTLAGGAWDASGQWVAAGRTWTHIYGAYGTELLGVKEDNGAYTIESYPGSYSAPVPDGMPVAGTSLPAVYKLPMGDNSQCVMLGGMLPDGSLSADAWSFDGTSWVKVSGTQLPFGLQDITLVQYDLSEMKPSNWAPYSYPVLLALGGRNSVGAVNRYVYISRDWGMTWKKGPDNIQLPAQVPSFYAASGFTYTSTMHAASRTQGWTPVEVRPLQPFCCWPEWPVSRAVAPITEWPCQAVYIFGGRNYDGQVYNTLWRGVVLEFTFKPVQ